MTPETAWIIGHAAQTNRVFTHCGQRKMFAAGCFRQACEAPNVVLCVNHACVRGFTFGQPWGGEIDWRFVLASTRDGTLCVEEDLYGLFFRAQFRTDACVSYADSPAPPINIHQAIARGQCPGLSIFIDGGDRVVGRQGIPADVLVTVRAPVREIALMLPPEGAASDTNSWVMPAGPAALQVLEARLRAADAMSSEGVHV